MSDNGSNDLESRLNRLERELAELRKLVGAVPEKEKEEAPRQAEPAKRQQLPIIQPPPRQTQPWQTGEFWLGRVGTGLLILGLVFLFKYAVDQGWLTPWTRVSLGLVAGGALAVLGVRSRATRPHLAALMQGTSLVAFYLCPFSAFQLYGLVGYPAAMIWMSLVTAVGLLWAAHERELAYSLVAALGGLATPFLLYTGSGSAAGLMGYLAAVLAGCLTIFALRGWRSLLVVSALGGWLVIAQGVGMVNSQQAPPSSVDTLAVLLTVIILGWLALWLIPVIREILENNGRLARPVLNKTVEELRLAAGWLQNITVRMLVPLLPLASLVAVSEQLDLTDRWQGWLMIAACAIYSAAYALLYRRRIFSFTGTHGLAAVATLSIGLLSLLPGDNAKLAAISAVVLAVLYLARRLDDRVLRTSTHLLAFGVSAVLASRLIVGSAEVHAVFSAWALANLAVLAMLAASSFLAGGKDPAAVYRLAAHAGFLAWLARELARLPGGDGWVSASWGLYSLALMIPGLRLGNRALRNTGLATLFLTVGKLLIVDMARVDPLWRILLFMAFGSMLLGLGYWLRNLWRTDDDGAQ